MTPALLLFVMQAGASVSVSVSIYFGVRAAKSSKASDTFFWSILSAVNVVSSVHFLAHMVYIDRVIFP